MVPTSSPSVLGEGPSQLCTEQGEWAKEASKGPSGQGGCKGQEDTGSLALTELVVQGRRQPGKHTNVSQLALQGAVKAQGRAPKSAK